MKDYKTPTSLVSSWLVTSFKIFSPNINYYIKIYVINQHYILETFKGLKNFYTFNQTYLK